MNEKNNKINREVEETLASLDDLERVEANPFHFTRIMQQMQEKQKPLQTSIQLIWRVALVGLLVLLNVVTLLQANVNQRANRAAYIEGLAEEYALNFDEDSSSIYYWED